MKLKIHREDCANKTQVQIRKYVDQMYSAVHYTMGGKNFVDMYFAWLCVVLHSNTAIQIITYY